MPHTKITLKAYRDGVEAQLHDAKSQLEALETKAKDVVAKEEIDALKTLHSQRLAIEKKLAALETQGETKFEELKGSIDGEVAKLHSTLAQIAKKLNHPDTSHKH
jgi:archaellum component FlaC